MYRPLTKRQSQIYLILKNHFDGSPYCGLTLAEIAEKLKSRSKSGVHRLVSELEKKGYIAKVKGAHCGIYLTGKQPLLKRDT